MLDLQRGLGRKALEPQGITREHMLAQHLPYITPVGDDVVMLRDGDVMGSFTVRGLEAATAEAALIDDVKAAMENAVAQMGPDVALYIHRVSMETQPQLPPVQGDGFAVEVDRVWQRHIARDGLRERTIMVTVCLRPRKLTSLWSKISGGGKTDLRGLRDRRIARLNEIIAFMMQVLRPVGPRRLTVGGGQWLGLLRTCVTGQYAPLTPGSSFEPLSNLMAGSRVDFRGDTFTVFGTDSEDTRYGAIFGMKGYPSETMAGIFDRFDMAADMVVTHSFTPMDLVTATGRLQRTIRQMRAADDAALSLQAQLVEASDQLASGRIVFGHHLVTIMAVAESRAELDDIAASIRSAGQRAGAVIVREDINARTAYFAQHPGNYGYRSRASMTSSRNFASFASLHAAGIGVEEGREPWGVPLTILPTVSGEPYRFNFHAAGAQGERTVGHSLTIGRTGTGKSVGIAFLAAQVQRANPRIIAFDKDNGLEMPLRALGGSYAPVRMGEVTDFNPFAAETDERGRAWLTDWLSALLEQNGPPLTAEQSESLSRAVTANAESDAALQNVMHFRSQLLSVDDGGDLYTRMGVWDTDGQYGWVFGGMAADPVHFDQAVTGFDLTEILDVSSVRTAWLSYVFRRIERTVEDGRPTLLILDEAWKLLDDPYFEARLKDWMLTMRKKNVAVVMLTQRVSHIAESRAGNSILESVNTTIVFPNRRNTAEELAPLNLSDSEEAFLMNTGGASRAALVRNGDTSTVVDLDLSALGPLLRVLAGGKGDDMSPANWRDNPDFWKEM
ncbi:hypothetical protein [Falsirhodobacter sp. 1013]|uniref:VirB4 family type IV secretion/conjugal transfer ATPase n=1 Tax=Falsirhodobacter sp. 1013 TaxID=3417566 RepID=UPI003EBB24A2